MFLSYSLVKLSLKIKSLSVKLARNCICFKSFCINQVLCEFVVIWRNKNKLNFKLYIYNLICLSNVWQSFKRTSNRAVCGLGETNFVLIMHFYIGY